MSDSFDDQPVDEPVGSGAGTPDEREQALDSLARLNAATQAHLLRAVVTADEAKDYQADGCRSMAEWLAYRYRLPAAVARQWVKVAHMLTEMPRLAAQLEAGNVSLEQLVQVQRFAEPEDDATLARLVPSLSHTEVEAMAERRRRIKRREADSARGQRHLHIRPDRSGLGSRVSGFLPTEDAAIVKQALDRRAESAGPDPATGVWEPHPSRMADALRDVCAEDLADHAAGSSEPDASVVVVHVPASTVGQDESGPDGSATIGGLPIHNRALHRILCDTRIEFHVDDPAGATIGIGRASRTPPRWLRRRVVGRDHSRCRWPGCDRAIRHLHHMQHWTRGGPTDAANLLGVCWDHHHLLHEGGWTATGNADTTVTLTHPNGRTLHSQVAPMAA